MFEKSKCSTDKKLANFTKYVRRQHLARFMVQYELFKRQLNIKGSIVECGVHNGGGVMSGSNFVFQLNWFEDVVKTFDFKIKALDCYQSEMREWPHPRSLKNIKNLAQCRGSMIGCEFAEGFMLLRIIQ